MLMLARLLLRKLAIHLAVLSFTCLSQIVKQVCARDVVKGPRHIKQQETGHSAGCVVPLFVDPLCDEVKRVLSELHLSASMCVDGKTLCAFAIQLSRLAMTASLFALVSTL